MKLTKELTKRQQQLLELLKIRGKPKKAKGLFIQNWRNVLIQRGVEELRDSEIELIIKDIRNLM